MSKPVSDSVLYNLQNGLKALYSRIPLKYRFGKRYRETRRFLKKAQWWEKDKIELWQLDRFRHIVEYAIRNVPGYYFLYKESKIAAKDIRNVAAIKNLPLVSKELISDNLEDFSSRAIATGKRLYTNTSGSTGMPFRFYHTKLNVYMENAFLHSGWERVGWKDGDKFAVLRGKFIGNEETFYFHDSLRKQLLLSSYYLTEKTYKKYIEKILEYAPAHLRAYPSVVCNLANYIMQANDIGIIKIKSILLGSENIYDWQKDRLSEAFPGVKLFGWYGHAEHAILALMCEYSDLYHICPFYGLAEVLNGDNEEVAIGKAGELVGTSFWSYATPFIRYKTADVARKGNFGCDKCGRKFQLIDSVDGRVRDILVSKTGRRFPAISAANFGKEVFKNIKQFQYYQDTPGELLFKIVKKDSRNEVDTQRIYEELVKKIGGDMEIQIIFTEEISTTSGGKYRVLEQKLNLEEYF